MNRVLPILPAVVLAALWLGGDRSMFDADGKYAGCLARAYAAGSLWLKRA